MPSELPTGTRKMELAKYERKRRLAHEQAKPSPLALDILARAYLEDGQGITRPDLDAVNAPDTVRGGGER